jgi:glyceraldehyde-3-phosphate dehydrogenase/erythrose-4-phosphate dehydrogenase
MATVATNGLGRIGRAALKVIHEHPHLELAAVNDVAPVDDLAYLTTSEGEVPEHAYREAAAEVSVEARLLIVLQSVE